MIFINTYLLGAGLAAVSAILLTKWANKNANDRYYTLPVKLGVFGALCNQLTLFGTLELISIFHLGSLNNLLKPYMLHQENLQYSSKMLWIRLIMFVCFILTAMVVLFHEHKYEQLESKGSLHP